jgi:hypothetical protein
MVQSSIGVTGITVVESTGEEGEARYKVPPSTLSEESSSPRLALGSDDKREEGPTGSHLWEVVDDTHMNVDQYRKAEGASDIEHTDKGDQRERDTSLSGVEAILKVKDDLRKDRENQEALVDALLVQEILSSVIHYFSSDLLSPEERQAIIDLIVEIIIDCDLNYGEKAAIKWVDGFKWRKETLDKDLALFMESGMDIKIMVATRLTALKHDRLNPQRVGSLRADNPERKRLLGLCEGMVVPKPEGFVPNGATSSKGLHKVYKRVHAAVDRMLGENTISSSDSYSLRPYSEST